MKKFDKLFVKAVIGAGIIGIVFWFVGSGEIIALLAFLITLGQFGTDIKIRLLEDKVMSLCIESDEARQ